MTYRFPLFIDIYLAASSLGKSISLKNNFDRRSRHGRNQF